MESTDYQIARNELHKEGLVYVMTVDVMRRWAWDFDAALADISHKDGTPNFSFMQKANAGYRSLGGKVDNKHLGAVAEVIVDIIQDVYTDERP